MLIALLAVLGVDLLVIVVVFGAVLARRRWVGQPGAFKGLIRVIDGDVPGLGSSWKRGYGRWVRDVLVWSKAPFLFRSEELAVDGLAGEGRAAVSGEVKRVGNEPRITRLATGGGARIEVAAPAESGVRVLGPFAGSEPAVPSDHGPPT